ncbi:uncharacterized protein ACB058_004120 [Synchiropus picturatus]
MKRRASHGSRWEEKRSTLVYAIRSATFGSWRQLTMGAEYQDNWAPSPHRRPSPRCRIQEPVKDKEEEKGEEPTATAIEEQKNKRTRRSNGVCQIVTKHEDLNSVPRCPR